MKYGEVKGFRTLTPDIFSKYRFLDQFLGNLVEQYGYNAIETPSLEYAEVLLAKGNLNVDQVKEIFLFKDYGNRDVGLRFDLTAPLARWIGENYYDLKPKMPLRLYYFTRMWRYEKPQKGRYREFWQFGIELIDSESIYADAEIIEIAAKIFKELKLDNVKIFVSHRELLKGILENLKASNIEECLRWLDKKGKISDEEILQVLSKNINDLSIIRKILDLNLNDQKGIEEFLKSLDDGKLKNVVQRIIDVKEILKQKNIEIMIDPSLVRGFDYYTGIVFEANVFENKKISSSLLGGGRYDGLIQLFGGERTPSLGFAFGVDRLIEELEQRKLLNIERKKIHIIYEVKNKEHHNLANDLFENLKNKYVVTKTLDDFENFGKLLKNELKFANNNNYDYAIIIDDNIKNNEIIVKELKKGEQQKAKINQLTLIL
ncbi:MAG: histidine--tRNA ligase [Candidatus Woesearchaeota archaeon]